MDRTVLVTGATGYVGGLLLDELLKAGHRVRALARKPDNADLPDAVEVMKGDVVSGDGLAAALDGIEVAYYLVHSMGRGNQEDFAEKDRRGARNFGRAAREAGVQRVIYLGGLEGESDHLRSREEVAEILTDFVDDTIHARAAMIIGAGSTSFIMLRSLVERLPAMIAPKWIETKTQPIGVSDVVRALAGLAVLEDAPAEVELGGADVLSYGEMLDRYADLAGLRRRPRVPVPVLSPRLSSYWVGFVTPVETALAKPLVQGLSAEMLVRKPPPQGINDDPMGFDDAVRAALA